jgi:hypothetical protein
LGDVSKWEFKIYILDFWTALVQSLPLVVPLLFGSHLMVDID